MPNVEIGLTNNGWNGDFQTDSTGDLVLVSDQPNAPVATQERVYRLLMTSARDTDEETGSPSSVPDDLFAPDWGASLRRRTGEMITPQLLGNIESDIESGLQLDETIDQTTQPTVILTTPGNNTVQIALSCNAITGDVITIPSFTLPLSGS